MMLMVHQEQFITGLGIGQAYAAGIARVAVIGDPPHGSALRQFLI